MRITLIDDKKLINLTLPTSINGNYWLTNAKNDNLVNIEAIDGKWIINSNSDIKVFKKEVLINDVPLSKGDYFIVKNIVDNISYEVYCDEVYNSNNLPLIYEVSDNLTFYIGNNNAEHNPAHKNNSVSFNDPAVIYNNFIVTIANGTIHLKNLNESLKCFVNGELFSEGFVGNGDYIFFSGYRFTFINNILLLNNPSVNVSYDTVMFRVLDRVALDFGSVEDTVDNYVEVFDKKDYYLRPPRFSERVESVDFVIDPPPNEFKDESMPVLLTMGPMVIMGMSSCVTGAIAFVSVMSGEATFKDSIGQILTAVAMLGAMIVFPFITKMYNKSQKKKKEKKRQELYSKYLDEKKNDLFKEMQNQTRILTDTFVSLDHVLDVIKYRKRNLWERLPEHPDFLELRVGLGNVSPYINLKSPEEHFTLDQDNLREKVYQLKEEIKFLENVPVTIPFKSKFTTGLIGNEEVSKKFIDGLILQMITYHSWSNLKIVILSNESNHHKWSNLKNLPYLWNNEKTIRFFGSNNEDNYAISNYLTEIYNKRKQYKIDNGRDMYLDTNYLIITDDIEGTRNLSIMSTILENKVYLGFGVLFSTDRLNILSNDVSTFINLSANEGQMFENELVNNKKTAFKPDLCELDLNDSYYLVSNIPIDLKEGKYELPEVLSFLEMYGASNVKQLNSVNKWRVNDPTKSLSAPVGINESGDLFKLDLHEKIHGPHGLIAGMTGSGKSEFIITYILSMAVNYHPNEVNFVLIDYKGGGLAGAFENKETGVSLPHLAGTITNLDITEINRSLSSLQSELKRRQRIFNEARDKVGESTIDIYKYQKLYRAGKVTEPISHLFIISDEFAELKVSQPEFMAQLISTARIGRSLGVHLILATQKPSGVVDDQIWSNSKFRVCLKVQDKSDSNDMIKSPAAALLKETGRFYLQVGFNEFFALGQSAWCGATYYESDKRRKKVNTSVDFVDNVGSFITSEDVDKNTDLGVLKGEELPNILNYLIETVKHDNIKVKKLWLSKIPANIFIDDLKVKYDYHKQDFDLNIVIGEYDAPNKQEQGLLTLPITKEGNALIYGMVGSGKDSLINSIIYSLITTYTVDEVNIYVIDFGSETTRLYKNAPQIGGLAYSSDKDKIDNLFKMFIKLIEERKKLFVEYNGSYVTYIKNSKKVIPNMVMIINNFEAFNDTYGVEHFETLVKITREGPKYGIFVIASVNGSNGMRSKLSQNFGISFTLQLSDDFEYRSLVGRTEVVPSKISGRGLYKLDSIYEFQSAKVSTDDKINEKIKAVSEMLDKAFTKSAMRIPELPKLVSTIFVKSEFDGLHKVPIGVDKNSLAVRTVDLKNSPGTLVSSMNVLNTKSFVASLIYELTTIKRTVTFVFDAERLLKSESVIEYCKYFNTSFDNNLTSFVNIVDKLNDLYTNSDFDYESIANYENIVCVFIGIDKLKTILGDKFLTLFSATIEKSKKLQKFSYVFVDSVDMLKKMEYDGWYKSVVNSSRGIWIGNGIAEQNLLRIGISTRNLANTMPPGFAYDIVGGNPYLIKYIESYEQESNYDTL